MTKRVTFTQAELERAWKVAQKVGATVKVERGAIHLLREGKPVAHHAASDEVEECDRIFGGSG